MYYILNVTLENVLYQWVCLLQKPFPLTAKLDDIQDLLDKFGQTENIFMRKDAKRKFKASKHLPQKLFLQILCSCTFQTENKQKHTPSIFKAKKILPISVCTDF